MESVAQKRLAGKRLLLGDLQYPSFAFDQNTAYHCNIGTYYSTAPFGLCGGSENYYA